MSKQKNQTAIFVMPRTSEDWQGAEALWITVAGWAAAAEKKFGNAIILTQDKISRPNEILDFQFDVEDKNIPESRRWVKGVPRFLRVFINDLLLWGKSKNWKIIKELPQDIDVAIIWEQHDFFIGPGKKLSERYRAPLVKYVHAPYIWEAEKWGIKRYFWGRFIERFYELSSLNKADLVLCVSDGVAKKLEKMGVNNNKILISPMAVDLHFFRINSADKTLGELKYDPETFIIGWTGSFRPFHGLFVLIEAFGTFIKNNPDSKLLLIGDGAEKIKIENLVKKLGLEKDIIFVGKKNYKKIPGILSLFDIAVVSADKKEGFHYFPIKLMEYMAAGKPCLAPNAGDISKEFENDVHLKLYEPGNPSDLYEKMEYFKSHKKEADMIALRARAFTEKYGTWDAKLEKVLIRLKEV